MSARFFCDICGEETTYREEMPRFLIDKRRCESKHIITAEFETCKKCGEKLLKPVKEYRTIGELNEL